MLRDSLARCHAKAERFGRGERMVTCAANVGARKLVAEASGHPIQRHQSHLKGEGRLALYVIARGTHQGLWVDGCAPSEPKGQVVLLQGLRGREPLPFFTWRR